MNETKTSDLPWIEKVRSIIEQDDCSSSFKLLLIRSYCDEMEEKFKESFEKGMKEMNTQLKKLKEEVEELIAKY